jgi:hypothetical protein
MRHTLLFLASIVLITAVNGQNQSLADSGKKVSEGYEVAGFNYANIRICSFYNQSCDGPVCAGTKNGFFYQSGHNQTLPGLTRTEVGPSGPVFSMRTEPVKLVIYDRRLFPVFDSSLPIDKKGSFGKNAALSVINMALGIVNYNLGLSDEQPLFVPPKAN